MNFVENLFGGTTRPALTKGRIWFALFVAVIIDGLQFGMGPLGWVFADEALDVVGMILISWAIGFHMLLLPTFVIKSIPGPDMLPTWTACTAAVIMLRKKAQPRQVPPPIDVSSEVTPVPPDGSNDNGQTAAPNPRVPPKLSKQN